MWTHKKYKNSKFQGSYKQIAITHTGKRERVFMLTAWKKNGDIMRVLSFESWQAAKSSGWVKA
jgi:hypothetical protein